MTTSITLTFECTSTRAFSAGFAVSDSLHVHALQDNGLATAAGLMFGDLVTRLNAELMNSPAVLYERLSTIGSFTMVVSRGTSTTIDRYNLFTLSAHKALPDYLQEGFRMELTDHLVIKNMLCRTDGSACLADRTGFKKGDRIVGLNGAICSETRDQLVRKLRSRGDFDFVVLRPKPVSRSGDE